MSMDAIHVYVEDGGEYGKVGGNIPPKIDDCLWTVHESWCHAKPPFTLNIQLQEGQGMRGYKGEDHLTNTINFFRECGERDGKGANRCKKGEGTTWGKLWGMGMMGRWIEAKAHLGIEEKLITSSSYGAW